MLFTEVAAYLLLDATQIDPKFYGCGPRKTFTVPSSIVHPFELLDENSIEVTNILRTSSM